jgi:hypothetical protein
MRASLRVAVTNAAAANVPALPKGTPLTISMARAMLRSGSGYGAMEMSRPVKV